MKRNTFYILHFTFYILLILTISNCSDTTEVSKGSLSGTVNLEGETDHSNIIIAIYELAELDETIVGINQQYPHIGVIINQHTEFDHRLQEPVKYTETDAEGYFEIKKIPTGTYNIVALKDNFGFKYIYEVEIAEGENELSELTRTHPSIRSATADKSFKIEGKKELTPDPSLQTNRGEYREIPIFKGELKGVKSNRLSESRKLSELTPQPPLFNSIEGEIKSNRLSEKLLQGQTKTVSGVAPYSERRRKNLIGKENQTTVPLRNVSGSRRKSLSRSESDITLYEEVHISGNISGSVTVETNHHLIIDDDTVFVPNTSSLTIQSGAIIRINPGIDLTIHGTLTAQGEENNMFWVTTNAGFALNDSSFNFQFSIFNFQFDRSEELLLYNSMELSSFASISDDLIEWGKFDWGTLSLSSSVSNADFSDCIFRNSESGLIIDAGSVINTENILAYNCSNSSYGGIVCFNTETLTIEKGIYLKNYNGIYFKFCDNTLIKNNYISNNYRGIWSLTVFGDIEHNELTENTESDVKLAGNTIQGEINILYNNIKSNKGIWQYEQGSFSSFYTMVINFNNFHCEDLFILYDSSGISNDIDATNNYFDSLNTEDEIRTKIIDTLEEYSIIVLIDNWTQYLIPNAGIN